MARRQRRRSGHVAFPVNSRSLPPPVGDDMAEAHPQRRVGTVPEVPGQDRLLQFLDGRRCWGSPPNWRPKAFLLQASVDGVEFHRSIAIPH